MALITSNGIVISILFLTLDQRTLLTYWLVEIKQKPLKIVLDIKSEICQFHPSEKM